MTLIIAILMTLLVGMFIGVFGTFYVLSTQDEEVPVDVRLSIHPSGRRINHEPILDYSKTQ